ncbi:MAG: hypothetical protein K6B46_01215 [Opitutales bacterium]|nr:hypothetical protein [Opitutales bacterium]
MIFNSLDYALFLPVVFLLYWYVFCGNAVRQNCFLLLASLFFYGYWDWRFLGLLLLAGAVSFFAGTAIDRSQSRGGNGRWALTLAVVVNLGILALFKYYDFFVQSFADIFLAGEADGILLNLILPVGVSFYLFQATGYCFDVYRKVVPAERDVLKYFTFICFFPQLLAGPIGRAKNLLPQFSLRRDFDVALATDGLRQILWGLFKKTVVADNCASAVNAVWSGDLAGTSASTLVAAAVLYSFQIYGDFSGYSDMAIGSAKLLGIRLGDNFLFPYFSRNVGEFWRRWHISLNTWFRDYLYIPMGGSRAGKWKTLRNTLTVFGLSGLWHGANWTYVFWGLYHGLLFVPAIFGAKRKKERSVVAEDSAFPSWRELCGMAATYFLVVVGWIFFRAPTIGDAFDYLGATLSPTLFSVPAVSGTPFIFVALMMAVEWFQRRGAHGLWRLPAFPRWARWIFYIAFIFFIIQNDGAQETFIYFKF